ncbi:MAG TPA: hypothetical protein VFE15_13285 [Marmoricola sp.]|jgi:hypothetical protein|nr:hypothetical protein [Marmoricola sp.]
MTQARIAWGRTRRFASVLLLAVLTVSAGLAAPASAAPQIGLSADGQTWSATLPAPLFDAADLWVPGDMRTASFYVRNQAADSGTLSVTAVVGDPDKLLDHRDVALQVRRDSGPWVSLPAGTTARPFGDQALAAAAQARIDIRAELLPSSPNRSQTTALHLDFRVGLTERAHQAAAPTGHGGGLLPETGGVPFRVLAIGLALVAAGVLTQFFLLISERREDRDD